jgi:hypothetical protein
LNPLEAGDVYWLREGRNGRGQTSEEQAGRPAGCYLLAVWTGLSGFKEVRTRAGIAAGLIEVAAFATLALAVQATYDGHPLYTYAGHSGPRQTRGNNLDLNGGLWYEVRVSG